MRFTACKYNLIIQQSFTIVKEMELMELPRLRQDIFLIGDVDIQIVGNKLPTKLQALKVLFFYLRCLKRDLSSSLSDVINEVLIFWNKAEIPTTREDHCKEKLRRLYDEWCQLGKHKQRGLDKQQFQNSIQNLFDIASADALDRISENKKIFLLSQRPNATEIIDKIVESHDAQNQSEEQLSSQASSLSIEEQGNLFMRRIFIIYSCLLN